MSKEKQDLVHAGTLDGDYLSASDPVSLAEIDLDSDDVRISDHPLPRKRNPAFVHIRDQESKVSADSKRSQLNRLATMLEAPKPDSLEVYEDGRKTHPNQLYAFDYVYWQDISPSVVKNLLSRLRDKGLSAATRNAYRAALRGVAVNCWSMKLVKRDGTVFSREDVELINQIKPVKNEKLTSGNVHPENVIDALLGVCDAADTAIGNRDALMISMMVATGPRRAEIVGIKMSDIDFDKRDIDISGKGNKDRRLRIPDAIWERLIDYCGRFRSFEPGFLFTAIWNKRNRPSSLEKGLSTASVNARLDKIRQRAELKYEIVIAPHDLRRTFATDFLKNGGTMRALQKLLGHASMVTTERYVLDETEEYRQQAADTNAGRFGVKRR